MSTDLMFQNLRATKFKDESRPATRDSLAYVKVGSKLLFQDQVYKITDISTLQESNKSFSKLKPYKATEFSLLSLNTGDTGFIEWAYDDELEVYFTERKVKAVELGFNAGDVKSKSLISLDGVDYGYEDKWYGVFSKDGEGDQNVVIYEYESASGKCLTFEGWVEGSDLSEVDYDVYISSKVKPKDLSLC